MTEPSHEDPAGVMAELVIGLFELVRQAIELGRSQDVPALVVVVAAAVQRAAVMAPVERLEILFALTADLLPEDTFGEFEPAEPVPYAPEPPEPLHVCAHATEIELTENAAKSITITRPELTSPTGGEELPRFAAARIHVTASDEHGQACPVEVRGLHVGEGDRWTLVESGGKHLLPHKPGTLFTYQLRVPRRARVQAMVVCTLEPAAEESGS